MSKSFSILLYQLQEPLCSDRWDFCAADTLEELGQQKFDAIVVEGLCSELKELKKFCKRENAIVVISDGLSYEETVSVLDAGISDYMTRPFCETDLWDALDRLAESEREIEQLVSYASQHSYCSREVDCIASPLLDYMMSSRLITWEFRQKIELAWQEALANALEHGNLELESIWKNDLDSDGCDRFTKVKLARLQDPLYADRKLDVAVTYKHGELSLTIKDSGSGFTLAEKIPLHEPYGRGISLMNAVMDEVLYENGGTQLTLKKRI